MTTFETSRLTLRPFADSDVDFVFDLYSRWDVMRYIGVVPRVMEERSQAETRIAASKKLDQHPVHGVWAVESRDMGAPVGVLLLKPIPHPRVRSTRGTSRSAGTFIRMPGAMATRRRPVSRSSSTPSRAASNGWSP